MLTWSLNCQTNAPLHWGIFERYLPLVHLDDDNYGNIKTIRNTGWSLKLIVSQVAALNLQQRNLLSEGREKKTPQELFVSGLI